MLFYWRSSSYEICFDQKAGVMFTERKTATQNVHGHLPKVSSLQRKYISHLLGCYLPSNCLLSSFALYVTKINLFISDYITIFKHALDGKSNIYFAFFLMTTSNNFSWLSDLFYIAERVPRPYSLIMTCIFYL